MVPEVYKDVIKLDVYNHLAGTYGIEKLHRILDTVVKGRANNKILEEKQTQRMLDRLAKMLPKNALINGAYYVGYRDRGRARFTHVAMWDGDADTFLFFRHMMGGGYDIEKLEYWGEDPNRHFDAFIPYKIIDKILVD
jgi:hypothetical protein